MSDTTRDPIIAARSPLPWASWQRSEDYYSEGALVWLDVDTRLRELSGDTRSLDDFARDFFGGAEGSWHTSTYTFDDVVAALGRVATFDWGAFLTARLEGKHEGAPLDGFERGGYRLVYREDPGEYSISSEMVSGNTNLNFSLGLTVSAEGVVQEVLWEAPSYHAGVTAGSEIIEIDGRTFTTEALKDAVGATKQRGHVALRLRSGKQERSLEVACDSGHRYPHLEPIPQARPRLDEILHARRAD